MGLCKSKPQPRLYDHFRRKEWDNVFYDKLGFSRKEVCDFYDLYTRIDVDGSGTISHDEFMNFFNVDGTRALAGRIFSALDIDKSGELDFFEFVVCCWSVCTVTQPQVCNFLMYLYDEDRSGTIGFPELALMLSDMMNRQSRSKARDQRISEHTRFEVEKILRRIKTGMEEESGAEVTYDDCQLDLNEFDKLISMHFDLFSPLYDTQRQLRVKVLGLEFWRRQIKHRQTHRLHKFLEKVPKYQSAMKQKDTILAEHRQARLNAEAPKLTVRERVFGNKPRVDLGQMASVLSGEPEPPGPDGGRMAFPTRATFRGRAPSLRRSGKVVDEAATPASTPGGTPR